jgi:predicted RNA-binding protein with PIN domain
MVSPTALLRTALEAAVQVARAGEAAEPSQPAPQALRRFLRFARLPAPALDIARKVLDEDDEFRNRVASQLKESDVGEAGWLWLTRPEGWEQRLDELRRRQAEADHQEREDRADRDAQRKLSFAEDRARRAEALLTVRGGDIEMARAELAQSRSQVEQLRAELERVATQLDELREQRNGAVRRLKEVEGELARRSADLRQARHEIRMREAELTEATARSAARPAAPPPPPPPSAAAAPRPGPAEPGLDRVQLAKAVARAAAAAEELSGSLAAASSLLAPPLTLASPAAPPASTPSGPRARRPIALPPGVFDDSAAAADHLLRAPGVLVLVDGYNVSKLAWPSLPIAIQRARLVDALAELHARCAAEVEVVFDGVDTEGPPTTSARAPVRVRFSPSGVEADDVLLELVARAQPDRPVVVVSSDNRVRDGARKQGANVLASRQLLAALGR